MESAGGIIPVIAAAIVMFVANSPLNEMYQASWYSYVLGMSVSHWINVMVNGCLLPSNWLRS
ncbi:hypothetical protein OK016_16460 [Vibrio chagasii]|nr:hypothetical protein [Vibrio chagasii]